jgi:hypothetical protein
MLSADFFSKMRYLLLLSYVVLFNEISVYSTPTPNVAVSRLIQAPWTIESICPQNVAEILVAEQGNYDVIYTSIVSDKKSIGALIVFSASPNNRYSSELIVQFREICFDERLADRLSVNLLHLLINALPSLLHPQYNQQSVVILQAHIPSNRDELSRSIIAAALSDFSDDLWQYYQHQYFSMPVKHQMYQINFRVVSFVQRARALEDYLKESGKLPPPRDNILTNGVVYSGRARNRHGESFDDILGEESMAASDYLQKVVPI